MISLIEIFALLNYFTTLMTEWNYWCASCEIKLETSLWWKMPSGEAFSLQNPTAELMLANPVCLHLLSAEASGSESVGRNLIS